MNISVALEGLEHMIQTQITICHHHHQNNQKTPPQKIKKTLTTAAVYGLYFYVKLDAVETCSDR